MVLYFGNIKSKGQSQIELIYNKLLENSEIIIASHFDSKLMKMLHMVYVFYKYLPKRKIVFIDIYTGKAFYYAVIISLLCRFHNVEYVPVCHGGKLGDRLKNNKILCKIIFSNSKINFTPSKMLVKKLKINNYRTEYVPNFINTNDYKSRVRGNLKPKILWVRAFHEIYNPVMALKTIQILKEEYPEIRLCMVGPDKDGSLKYCKSLAENLKIFDNIKFTGYLSPNKWHGLSKGYDIFINTTNFESFGLSLIEAGALGLPLVSTNAGEIKYVYEHGKNAMLVQKEDAVAMASEINRLLKDNNLAKTLSSNGIKRSQKYNWDSIKKHWIKYIPN